jgi:pantoate--beta-alanine ligase
MIIIKSAERLQAYILSLKKKGITIGFVPTMGALHEGHLSLITEAANACNICVCSIFINPTQFNNQDDFAKYPVTIENDILLLGQTHCDILFLPSVSEIYTPAYEIKKYELGKLETLLEGAFRPGHFQGVCQVVDRLLDLVAPDRMFLGQKDYQQCMILQKLIDLRADGAKTKLVFAPTIREKDGLAMSSRNMRLNKEQRLKAVCISQTLESIKKHIHQQPIEILESEAISNLKMAGFDVDYVRIVHAETLEPVNNADVPLVGLIAANIGTIRLIDNMRLN